MINQKCSQGTLCAELKLTNKIANIPPYNETQARHNLSTVGPHYHVNNLTEQKSTER